MAQRIMYSILPHLADGSQVSLTQGVVDVKGLKAAVEGRKDIIKYGVKAVRDELQNYGRPGSRKDKSKSDASPYHVVGRLIESNKLEEAMDIAITAYANTKEWTDRYGGRAWEMIARTIRQIIRLDRQLDIIRSKPRSADTQLEEVQVMRDLIVEMNVFDGLAHNSDSIMRNMIALETDERVADPKEAFEARRENYRQIKRLMDSKELDDPNEVFKQISNTLTGSGDINKFKDWVTKMRGKREFFQNDPKLVEKLFLIFIRKGLISIRGEMNNARDLISSKLNVLEKTWIDRTFREMFSKFEWAAVEVQITADEFAEYKKNFFRQYRELDDARGHSIIDSMLEKPTAKVTHLRARFDSIMELLTTASEAMTFDNGTIPDSEKTKILGLSKEALSLLNHFSYILDGI